MTKTINSKARLMAAIVFAIILCLGTAMPVFASSVSKATGDTPATQAKAAITKILKMPVGTGTPSKTFTYTFTKVSLDGNTGDTASMPAITAQTIMYSATDNGTTSGSVKDVRKQSADFAAANESAWPHAGVYQYLVKEQDDTANNTLKDTYTYSPAQYHIFVYVDNGPAGMYVAYVEARIVVVDDYNKTEAVGAKVDPTPGTDPNTGNHSKIAFTNTYLKNNGGTDTSDPNKLPLKVSKMVAGLGANQSLPFEFTVKVTKPDVGTITNNYKAAIMEGTTVITPTSGMTNGTISGNYIEFPSGTAVKVNLTHGQTLAFLDTHVGTAFEVTETGTAGYKASYSLVSNENQSGTGGTASDKGDSLSIPTSPAQHVGDIAANSAAFLNDTNAAAPTGISVDNLPFIVMILVMAGAIAGFVTIRFRRNARNNA